MDKQLKEDLKTVAVGFGLLLFVALFIWLLIISEVAL
jgi:hypothetical protein